MTIIQLRPSGWSKNLSQKIIAANTARHAFDMIYPDHPEVIAQVGRQVISSAKMFAGKTVQINCLIFDYEGKVAFDSSKE